MRAILRKTTRLLAPAAVAAVAVLSLAPAASADPVFTPRVPPECKPGSICAWSGQNFTGQMIFLQPGVGCVNTPFPIQSIANTFGSPGIPAAAAAFSALNCQGTLIGGVGQTQALPVLSPPALSVFLVW
jgi:hypothetical protein